MTMTTIYRNGQPTQITTEEFNRRVEELGRKRAEAKVIAHYKTRGGKYEIIIKEYEHEGQVCYNEQYLTNGKSSGGGGGHMPVEELTRMLARHIYNAARIDNINYKPVVSHAPAEALLAENGFKF